MDNVITHDRSNRHGEIPCERSELQNCRCLDPAIPGQCQTRSPRAISTALRGENQVDQPCRCNMRSQHVLGGRSTSHGVRNATGPPARFSLVQVSHLNIRMVARLAVLACIMASSSAFAPSVSNLALRSASSCRLHSCAPSRAVRLGRLRMQQQVHSSLHLAMRSDSCKRSSPLLAGPSEQSCTQLLRRSV